MKGKRWERILCVLKTKMEMNSAFLSVKKTKFSGIVGQFVIRKYEQIFFLFLCTKPKFLFSLCQDFDYLRALKLLKYRTLTTG